MTFSKRAQLLLEVAIFIGLAFASKVLLYTVAWRYAGPVSLVLILCVLTVYLRRTGETWKMFGLRSLPGIKAKLMVLPKALLTLAVVATALLIVLGTAQFFSLAFMFERPEGVEERWGNIRGNLPLYLVWLGIVWTAAAFGEEMFFRGYLITRLSQVFSGSVMGPVLAVLLAAAIFGFGHMYYQGLRGFLTVGAVAIAFGTMFLLFKKDLWPVILVHGFVDTVNFTALYLGKV